MRIFVQQETPRLYSLAMNVNFSAIALVWRSTYVRVALNFLLITNIVTRANIIFLPLFSSRSVYWTEKNRGQVGRDSTYLPPIFYITGGLCVVRYFARLFRWILRVSQV